MDNISSGLYRYAGSPAYAKFRIVFTDPSECWVSEASRTAQLASNYNQITKKSTSINREQFRSTSSVPNLDALHQASFIISKQPNTGQWIANEEELSKIDADGTTTDLTPSAINANQSNDKGRDRECLAATLRREGFKLCVTTSKSRSKCHVCRQKLFSNFVSSHDDEISCSRESRLFDEGKQNYVELDVAGEADKLAAQSAGGNFRTPLHDDVLQDENRRNLVVKQRCASNWGDSPSTTSISCNHGYWRYIDSRKLATDSDNIARARSNLATRRRTSTIDLMMRNHHLPVYKSCQCSRIKSARIDKETFNGLCADSFVCTLCYSLIDNGIASDNNENRNNRDRRRDNRVGGGVGEKEIPVKKIPSGCCYCFRCRKTRENCLTGRLQSCRASLCNCRELGEGYKTYQRSASRLSETTSSEQLSSSKPHNDNLISLFWTMMMGNVKQQEQNSNCTRFNIETSKLSNRKLAKLMVTRNEQHYQSDYNLTLDHHNTSCDHEGFDSFQADNIDLIQETNDLCELGNEEDFLLEATRALGNPQAESKSSDETVNPNIKRRLKTLTSTPAADYNDDDVKLSDSFRGVSHLECHCCANEPHGETLLIILHRPRSIELGADPSMKFHSTDKTNDAAIQPDAAIESIGATDSGAIISAATSSTNADDNPAGEAIKVSQDNDRENLTGGGTEGGEDQRIVEIGIRPQKRDQDLKASDASQLSDSIVLAAIVIDAFNRIVQVTPELNELIMIDLSTLDAPRGEALDASALAATAGKQQSRLTRVKQISYHLETFNDAFELEASEHDLSLLRRSLGLHRFMENPIELMVRNPSEWGLNSLCVERFPTWLPERVLLQLQFDIDCVEEFSSSCWNLYIRYKVLAKKTESWQIRNITEETQEQQGRDHYGGLSDTIQVKDRLLRLQTISSASQANHHCGKDKTNLEHVTHFGRDAWRHAMPISANATSTISYSNSVASNIVTSMATDNKCHSGDKDRQRAIDVTSVMESHRLKDLRNDNELNDANGGVGYDDGDDDEAKYQLILEGSTITSRPDSSGRFNFCCVEQLLLELSSRRQTPIGPPQSGDKRATLDERKFSATRMNQDDAKIPATSETIAHKMKKKIAAQIDEQKSSKSNDRNQMQTPNGEVVGRLGNLPTNDLMISPVSSELKRGPSSSSLLPPPFLSGADDEQVSSDKFVVITNENYPIKSEINHETDQNVQSPSDSDQMTAGDDDDGDEQRSRVGLINPETSNESLKSGDHKSVDSRTGNDDTSNNNNNIDLETLRVKPPRGAPSTGDDSKDVNNNTLSANDDASFEDNTFELIFVFEIYSRDFYTDKLKGWSSMKVPINLDRKLLINNNNNIKSQANAYQINNLIGGAGGKNLHRSRGCAKSAHHHDRCRRELPVMRPALSRPIDYLRYYTLGDIPMNTPSITSFVRSDCRYMTHTQHCGNLVVRLDTLRQHNRTYGQ